MIKPNIHPDTWIAEDAVVVGDVTLEEHVNVWYHAVVRGLHEKAPNGQVHIGKGTNIQDGCVLHVDPGYPLILGEGVTVGHMALLHGCKVGDHSLIGMGSIVLNGANIGKNCIIGAGSLVTGNTVIPDGYMAFGRPAKPVRKLTEEEIADIYKNAELYVGEAQAFFNRGAY